MGQGTHKVFHFYEDEGVIDIDAASYSEARRKFKESRGYFPGKDNNVEVEDI
jgi:hypothetical protein